MSEFDPQRTPARPAGIGRVGWKCDFAASILVACVALAAVLLV